MRALRFGKVGRPPRSKFSNRPLRCREGIMHQSTSEARRCDELHLMQQGGLISGLVAHPQKRYRLDVNDQHICDYLADFAYYDKERQMTVVEDVKGFQTEVSRLKLKLMAAIYGIDVELVRKGGSRAWR